MQNSHSDQARKPRESLVVTPAQLGQVLKGYRSLHRLTQNDLAALIGVDQSAISQYERDASRLNAQRLFRLLSAFGLELVLREKQPDKPPETEW